MELIEAVSRVDAIKPNGFTRGEKIKWLSVLDGVIKQEIIDTHEGAEAIEFNGYDEETSVQTVLLVPHPYDILYLRWLEMQIDYANGEYGKYNNSREMYNSAYSDYERYYNRTHMPKGKKFKYFGQDQSKSPMYEASNAVAKVTIEED